MRPRWNTTAEAVAAETGARVARDRGEILSDAAVDAVVIASSTPTHFELIERSVRAGKFVPCEKPLEYSLLL